MTRQVLHRVALALLLLNEDAIMHCKDMNEILMFIRNLPKETLQPAVLLPKVLSVKVKVRYRVCVPVAASSFSLLDLVLALRLSL